MTNEFNELPAPYLFNKNLRTEKIENNRNDLNKQVLPSIARGKFCKPRLSNILRIQKNFKKISFLYGECKKIVERPFNRKVNLRFVKREEEISNFTRNFLNHSSALPISKEERKFITGSIVIKIVIKEVFVCEDK